MIPGDTCNSARNSKFWKFSKDLDQRVSLASWDGVNRVCDIKGIARTQADDETRPLILRLRADDSRPLRKNNNKNKPGTTDPRTTDPLKDDTPKKNEKLLLLFMTRTTVVSIYWSSSNITQSCIESPKKSVTSRNNYD